jgi:hypothetical protein
MLLFIKQGLMRSYTELFFMGFFIYAAIEIKLAGSKGL